MHNPYDAGPPEADEVEHEVVCGAVVSLRFVTPELERRLKALKNTVCSIAVGADNLDRLRREVEAFLLDVQRTDVSEEVTCTFDGEVTMMVGQGRATWTCPRCGTEHDEDEDRYFPRP